MVLVIDSAVKERFPDLKVFLVPIRGIKVGGSVPGLKEAGEHAAKEARGRYTLESLKDIPIFRSYRDFFWRVGIDPTKNRPAAEALIRRILAGKPLPKINSLVDAYNLASIMTEIALAAFDEDKLKGDLTLRFAEKGESFLGIGMEKPMTLIGGEVVVSDEEKLVALYPHRDADNTKVTEKTKNVLLMVCGAPGILNEHLNEAARIAAEYVTRFCGGKAEKPL